MKLIIFLTTLVALGAGFYIYYKKKIYDPWEDQSWLASQVTNITSSANYESLSPEEKDFLSDFPNHQITKGALVWLLLNWTQENNQSLLVDYAKMYLDLNYPNHKDNENVEELASLGGRLLERKNFDMGASYFKKARELAGEDYQKEHLALWAFYEGYNYEQGGKTDRAVTTYKKSIELDNQDPRPYRQLGLIYFNRSSESENDHFSRALSRKYLSRSLELDDSQVDLQRFIIKLFNMEAQNISKPNKQAHFNPLKSKNKFPGLNPNPVPSIPYPNIHTPNIPNPGIQRRKKFNGAFR